jgi:transcriptional regulator GlxA family with amidase domain
MEQAPAPWLWLKRFLDRYQTAVGAIEVDQRLPSSQTDRLSAFFPSAATRVECLVFTSLMESLERRSVTISIRAAPRGPDQDAQEDPRVSAVLAFINANFQNSNLSLEMAAEHVRLTQWHVSRLIKHRTRRGFIDHLRDVRVLAAKRLLRDSKLSIKQIAFSVGFSNTDSLDRSFKRHTGLLPGAFRNSSAIRATFQDE